MRVVKREGKALVLAAGQMGNPVGSGGSSLTFLLVILHLP